MSNNLSPALIAQLYGQISSDPLLILLTLTHDSFGSPIRLVRNTEDVVSRGETFMTFPFQIKLPADDGESNREVNIEFDNVSQELIDELRTVVDPISVLVELVLASDPDFVQTDVKDLKLRNIRYNAQTINATLFMDSFLNVPLTSEKYTPRTFPGIF